MDGDGDDGYHCVFFSLLLLCIGTAPCTDCEAPSFKKYVYSCMHVCMHACMYVCMHVSLKLERLQLKFSMMAEVQPCMYALH